MIKLPIGDFEFGIGVFRIWDSGFRIQSEVFQQAWSRMAPRPLSNTLKLLVHPPHPPDSSTQLLEPWQKRSRSQLHSGIVHALKVFDSWILHAWSPKYKELFQIRLMGRPCVDPKKQGIVEDWTCGSSTRGRCSTHGSSPCGALKTARLSGHPAHLFCVTLQAYLISIGASTRSGQESWCLPYAGFFLLK